MTVVRMAIIGMGRMGLTHAAILNVDSRVSICGIADPSRLIRKTVENRLGFPAYPAYSDLLTTEQPDAVVVATPPRSHYQIATAAHRLGIHAFVEKPFTLSSIDAMEVTQAFRRSSLVNQVGYVNRFNRVFREVRDLVAVGVIGTVTEAKSVMLSATVTSRPRESGWRNSKTAGGGVVFEMASHAVDLLTFVAGPFTRVGKVKTEKIYSPDVPDKVSAVIWSAAGLKGVVEVNWSENSIRKPVNRIELVGHEGRIEADQYGLRIWRSDALPEHGLAPGWNARDITDLFEPVSFYLRGNEFSAQLAHFVDCVVAGCCQTECSFEDASATMEILESLATEGSHNGD
jgi:predicted dehydrogenase